MHPRDKGPQPLKVVVHDTAHSRNGLNGRIINVASHAHKFAKVDLDELGRMLQD